MTMEFVKNFGADPEDDTPVICLSRQKITLHFLRFGLFDNDAETVTLTSTRRQIEDQRASSVQQQDATYVRQVSRPSLDLMAENKGSVAFSAPKRESNDSVSSAKCRELTFDSYVGRPTNLFLGYLYLYHPNATDDEKIEEFYVDEDGTLHPIKWNGKDIRVPDVKSKPRHVYDYDACVKSPDSDSPPVVWVAFSQVQWSAERLTRITSAQSEYEKRMQCVVCQPLSTTGKDPNADALHVMYANDVTMTLYSDQKSNIDDYNKTFSGLSDQYATRSSVNDIFVVVHDPMYMADTICYDISRGCAYLESLVRSIKTGVSPALLLEGEPTFSCDDDEKSRQLGFLHLMAITAYHYIFKDEERREKYVATGIEGVLKSVFDLGILRQNPLAVVDYFSETTGYTYDVNLLKKLDHIDGLNKAGLLKMLAVEERRNVRDTINLYRDDLGILLTSDYYQDYLEDYIENIQVRTHDGRVIASDHLHYLAVWPHDIDGYIDLPEDNDKVLDDVWLSELTKIEGEDHSFPNTMCLLDTEVILTDFFAQTEMESRLQCPTFLRNIDDNTYSTELSDIILGNSFKKRTFKVAGKLAKVIESYRRLPFKADRYSFDAKGTLRVFFKKSNYEKFAQKFSKNIEILEGGGSSGKSGVSLVSASSTQQILKVDKSVNYGGKIDLDHCTISTIGAEKYRDLFFRIMDSKEAAAVGLLFQTISFCDAYGKLDGKGLGKDDLKAVLECVKLVEKGVSLLKKYPAVDRFIARNLGLQRFVKFYLPPIASAASLVIYCQYTYYACAKRDYDSAFFWGVAATATAVELALLCVGVGAFAWPMLIIAGIVMVAGVLAAYFSDTELETFFKMFPLASNPGGVTISAATLPHEYVNALYKNMYKICGGIISNPMDKDFECSYVRLTDHLMTMNMVLSADADMSTVQTTTRTDRYNKEEGPQEITVHTHSAETSGVVARIYSPDLYGDQIREIGEAFSGSSVHFRSGVDIEFHTYILNQDKAPEPIECLVICDDSSKDFKRLDFRLPPGLDINSAQSFMVLSRIKTPTNGHMPVDFRGPRYLVALLPLTHRISKVSEGAVSRDEFQERWPSTQPTLREKPVSVVKFDDISRLTLG